MSRTSPSMTLGRRNKRRLILSAALLSGTLIWDGAQAPAAAQAAPNQVIVNMDVLNTLPGAYGAQGFQPYGQPGYGTAPRSQFLPGAAAQGYAAPGYAPQAYPAPLGAPRYLPPYTPYGTAPAAALPLAPGLAGLAVPPSTTPSSVLTTLGPDGRPIQPIKLKKPGSTTSKPKKKQTYAAPTQTATAAPAPEPVEPAPLPDTTNDQVAAVTPPTPPAEPAEVPDQVPMPEATPAPDASASVVTAPPAPEPPAEEATAPQPPAEEQPAAEQPAEAATTETPPAEAPAEAPAEGATEETATAEAPAEPDNSGPAAPIPQGGIRIVFPSEDNEVPGEANAALDDLAGQMLADESMRIQILCYASGTTDTESKARRKSLARCINIRQYLFKKDVRTTRMDVRALGLKSEGQPADRVDIVPAGS